MLPTTLSRLFLTLGTLSAGLAVALGAYAAHGLKSVLSVEKLGVFHTAVNYQMYHSLALTLVGLWLVLQLQQRTENIRLLQLGGWCFVAGIVCFSGSLYILSFGGPSLLGPVTPVGGLFFLVGWAALATQAWRQ